MFCPQKVVVKAEEGLYKGINSSYSKIYVKTWFSFLFSWWLYFFYISKVLIFRELPLPVYLLTESFNIKLQLQQYFFETDIFTVDSMPDVNL